MEQIDPRIVRIGIEVDGQLKIYEGFAITATGTKYANANQDECEVTIANVTKETRDYILTETSPFNKNPKPKKLIVEAGRASYGYSRIFSGDIISAKPSQPPDITLTIKALTGNFVKGKAVGRSQAGQASLKKISQQVADDLGATLDFQAKDKNISNYSFTGGSLKQVDKLGETGGVDAYLDDGVLVVKDINVPLSGKVRVLNIDTGMIGIPEITEEGVKVTFLLDNETKIGGALDIKSIINPTADGLYAIYKLGFNITSRDTPFYWTASGKRIDS